ncbi:MAG: TetR/AcrR family transcriptional regulator [Candidatus Binatia bacterium]
MATKKAKGPRKTPRQERSRVTVEAILEAAAQVFESRGYAAGTTNHIAERAGVSIGSFYQYFPDKESVANVLIERHMQEGAKLFAEVLGHVGQQPHGLARVLDHFVGAMVEMHAKNPRLQHVLLEEVPHSPEMHEALRREKRKAMGAVKTLLESSPEVHVRDLPAAAYVVVNTVEGLTHEFVASMPCDLSQRRFKKELVAMLLGYLVGAPGVRGSEDGATR